MFLLLGYSLNVLLKICTNMLNRGSLLNYRILWQYRTCWFSYIISLYVGLFYINTLNLAFSWSSVYAQSLKSHSNIWFSNILHPFVLRFVLRWVYIVSKTEVSEWERIDQNHEYEMIKMSTSWQNEYELTEQLGLTDQMSTNWPNRWERVGQNENELT